MCGMEPQTARGRLTLKCLALGPVSCDDRRSRLGGSTRQTVYYPQAEATPVSIAPRSHWIGCPNWQCEPYDCGLGCMRKVIPAYPLVDLNKMFTPPFKVVQVP